MADEVKKKRRTPEELRAFHEAELKRLADREKAEVLRLLSDAHDTLKEAQSLKACPPLGPLLTPIAGLISSLTPKT